MDFTNTDLLYAGLVGSKAAAAIPRFEQVQNELGKKVLPPLPFLPFQRKGEVTKVEAGVATALWQADPPTPEGQQFFPLSFSLQENGQRYLLPYEPMLNISGSNEVVKRKVSKVSPGNSSANIGSIKERWGQDDYEVTITGVLIGALLTGDVADCYPIRDFEKLLSYLTAAQSLYVFSDPLEKLGIRRIVVESFRFPFTKGENVQAYEIKAVSDHKYDLFIPLTDDV